MFGIPFHAHATRHGTHVSVPIVGTGDAKWRVGQISREDVRGFAAALERKGSRQSHANALGTLHSLIDFAIDEGWMVGENPVKRVEKPALSETNPDVHFLELLSHAAAVERRRRPRVRAPGNGRPIDRSKLLKRFQGRAAAC